MVVEIYNFFQAENNTNGRKTEIQTLICEADVTMKNS
jgi:hypothetical protein